MQYLVLSQYREESGYKDIVGKVYHFPARYLKPFESLPVWFVYYEPRSGGEQVYFGAGQVGSVYEDTEDIGTYYADITGYHGFERPVDYFQGPSGHSWEEAKTMRNSVRRISHEVFAQILHSGGLSPQVLETGSPDQSAMDFFHRELSSLPGPGHRTTPVKRRIRRILETYERPSAITNRVKRQRNHACQICGEPGFIKRDGSPYCEVHHLFHLSDDPPAECLGEEYLAVLCANCHRRMHYGNISGLDKTDKGWKVLLDGKEYFIKTLFS